MKTLVFEGHSDDTFGEETTTNDNCGNGRPIVLRVEADGQGMYVWGLYSYEAPSECPACWVVGLQQLDEDRRLPPWPMTWGVSDGGYSPKLTVEAPDDVVVSLACYDGEPST